MINFKKLKKDCFWDYNFTDEELSKLASSSVERERSFLFEKILLNSTRLFNDLKIFQMDILAILITNYKVPAFNSEYANRRKNMAEVYFLDKPLV